MMLFLIQQVELDVYLIMMLRLFRFGSSVVIYSGQHNVQNYIKIIERLKVTMFLSVPGVYRQMLREIEANKKI